MPAADCDVPGGRRIPLWLKLVYTAYLAVLVPQYLSAYGPTNFLYFCDVALLMTLVALWREHSFFASTPLVGILFFQTIWAVDFLAGLVGIRLTGLTEYMFDPNLTLFTRGLSTFHFWLPILLLWTVWRLGYDRRAFRVWTAMALVLIMICYFFIPAPPPPPDNPNLPVNINYVYGFSAKEPQRWLPQRWWVTLQCILLPTVVYFPTHLLLSKLFGGPKTPANQAN